MPNASALIALRDVDPYVAAYIGLAVTIDTLTKGAPLVWSALEVGRRLEDETRARQLKQDNPKALKIFLKQVENASHAGHRHASITRGLNKEQPDWTVWSQALKVSVGIVVLDQIIRRTGYVEKVTKMKHSRKTNYLQATHKVMEWVTHQQENPILRPQWLPMLVKPRPWTTPYDGGYLSHALPPLVLIKTPKKRYLDEIESNPEALEAVYTAINALQETPWRINTRVLDVMSALWDLNAG